MAKEPGTPTIIKRKKVIAGGGHHGGAWKVAMVFLRKGGAFYADCSGRRVPGCARAGMVGSF